MIDGRLPVSPNREQVTSEVNGEWDSVLNAAAQKQSMTLADLSIENTPAASGMHRRAVVKDKHGNMKHGFSFGMNDNTNAFTNNFSNGSSNGAPARGKTGNGEVYADMTDPATKTVKTLKTTPAEDDAIVKYMRSRDGETAPYNALTNSCRDFSHREFNKIQSEIIRARIEKRAPDLK